MADQKFQRRTVLVKRQLQLKYVGVIFASVVLGMLMVGGDIYYTMTHLILNENPSLASTLSQVNTMLILKLSLYLGIMFLVSLFWSHRFAGPIYRFEKSAQVVATGDLTHRVSLRTGDDLLELQEEFNAMVSALQAQVAKDRTLIGHLGTRIDEALKQLPDGNDAVREQLKELRAELSHINTGLKV